MHFLSVDQMNKIAAILIKVNHKKQNRVRFVAHAANRNIHPFTKC